MTSASSASSDNTPSPPVRDMGPHRSADEGPLTASHRGHHLMALQQHIQQSSGLLRRMQLTLCSVGASEDFRLRQVRLG